MSAVMKPQAQWQAVCRLADILPDTGVAALIEGRQLAIFRVGDGEALYAIGNHDPFSGANVLSRGLVGDLAGELVVASPVYKQHFRLRDGVCVEDDSVCVGHYEVRLVGDEVQVCA